MTTGYTRLLDYLWRIGHFTGQRFDAVAGESITVVYTGEYDEDNEVWYGAEITVDGERRRGEVIVGNGVSDKAILRVVSGYCQPLLDFGDNLIPQISCLIDGSIIECYDSLRTGAGNNQCASLISGMDSLHRTDLFTKLLINRLQRKCGDVMEAFETSGKDWNQAFYVMLLRAMGGNRNKEAFSELASRATYMMVSREKSSQDRVEALLLGTSGFLYAAEEKDAYTLKLENEFRHIANKHSIIPLKAAEWDLRNLYMQNHPTLRLAGIAALLSKNDFLLETMLACRTVAGVEKLFCSEASEYWKTHCKPGVSSKSSTKRIGKEKARLVGINLVVPFMFAYGKQTGSEELCESSLDLLETIPAEKNEKLGGWATKGCVPENAFESQALLELNNEFCGSAACARCQIGRQEIKKALQRLS